MNNQPTFQSHPYICSSQMIFRGIVMPNSQARFILDFYNQGNRPRNHRWIRQLANKMLTPGQWFPELGAPIIFEKDTGFVLNGAHRLEGSCLAKVPLQCDIIAGVDRSFVIDIDNFFARSRGARICMASEAIEDRNPATYKRFNKHAAAAKLWAWQDKAFRGPSSLVTDDEVRQCIDDNLQYLEATASEPPFRKAGRAGVRAVCAQYMKKCPMEGLEFWSKLIPLDSFACGTTKSPVYRLRLYLEGLANRGGGEMQQSRDVKVATYFVHKFHNKEDATQIKEQSFWTF